jgi:hypothetical protein
MDIPDPDQAAASNLRHIGRIAVGPLVVFVPDLFHHSSIVTLILIIKS